MYINDLHKVIILLCCLAMYSAGTVGEAIAPSGPRCSYGHVHVHICATTHTELGECHSSIVGNYCIACPFLLLFFFFSY